MDENGGDRKGYEVEHIALKECVQTAADNWAVALVDRFKESEYMITVVDDRPVRPEFT